MSYTTMYRVDLPDTLTELAEFRNSHGFGPAVWSAVCARFLGDGMNWLLRASQPDGGGLWSLWKDPRMPLHWRVALACTFDRVVLDGTRLAEIAGYLRQFAKETAIAGNANHLVSIADELDRIEGAFGVVFHATSVSENPWREWVDANECDDDDGHSITYNFATGDEHFMLMEEIDNQATGASR